MDKTIDEPLIRRAQSGDEQAFEALITQSYDLIYRCALRWSGQPANAEDIAQVACIKVAQSLQQFRFESAFSSWLYRVVINCAKDWHRQDNRHSSLDNTNRENTEIDNAQPTHTHTSDDLNATIKGNEESTVFLRQVFQQLDALGEGFRETVMLVHGEGLNHREAAEVLNLKESTVSWRLHHIRKHLKTLPEYEHVQC